MFCSVNKHSCSMFYTRFTITNNTFNIMLFLPNLHVPLVRYDFISLNVSLCITDFTGKSILKCQQEYLRALCKINQKAEGNVLG